MSAESKDDQKLSQALTRTVFNSSSNILSITNISDGKFHEVNDAWLDTMGYTRDEVIGKTSMDLGIWLTPEDREYVVDAIRQNGQLLKHECSIGIKGGATIRIIYSGEIVSIDGEQRLLSVTIDISHLRRKEQELIDSEARYRDLIEGAVQGIIVQRDLKFLFVNMAYARMHGYDSPEDIYALDSILELLPKDMHPSVKRRSEDRIAGRIADSRHERRGLHRDGREILHDVSVRRVEWDGEPAIQAIVVDITDTRAAELKLRESESGLRRAQEIARVGSLTRIIETGEGEWSDQLRRNFGLKADDASLSHEEMLALIHPEDRGRVKLANERLTMVGDEAKHEYRVIWPDGSEHVLSAHMMVEKSGDGRRIKRGTIQDITEYKALENQLSQAQKMEAVGHLTGGVAHDFNNLLQVISGANSIIGTLDDKPEERQKWIDRIDASVERGASLTAQLLAYSQKQALNNMVLKPLRAIVDIEELLRRTLGEDIDLMVSSANDVSSINVDAHALQNALINLSLNARGAMPDGGNLTITMQMTTIGSDLDVGNQSLEPGRYIEISVADDGSGMSAETIDKAFDPFFTTKPVGEGSGLGLSMVYGFARQSGGLARISSTLGEGTVVTILLPESGEESGEQSSKAITDQEDSERAGSVLLVEDDPEVRSTTRSILEMIGYSVMEASDGAAALEIVSAEQGLDLVISDVVMPGGISGIELAHDLSQRKSSPRVLLISGYPEKVNSGIENGNQAFTILAKPFSSRDLREAIDTTLA
jgi:PAS domain S-box-containing protein